MNFFEKAKALASRGFHIFPIIPNGKLPAIQEWPDAATNNAKQIQAWWVDDVMELVQPFNVGICTSRFKSAGALLVVDVDNKDGKNGSLELEKLSKEGFALPETFTQKTPTGGLHLVFLTKKPVRNSVGKLAPGLDIRSQGGQIVGAGSITEKGEYTILIDVPPAIAPDWLVERCGLFDAQEVSRQNALKGQLSGVNIDKKGAKERSKAFLDTLPPAVEYAGGNDHTYKAFCQLRDYGLEIEEAIEAAQEWNLTCLPPWDANEFFEIARRAYEYAQNARGSKAPEAQFTPIEAPAAEAAAVGASQDKPPVDDSPTDTLAPVFKINKEYAFVLAGGGHHIIWETKGAHGEPKVEHLSELSFHRKFAAETLSIGGGKPKQLSEMWMTSHFRRSFDGIVFAPGREVDARFYNLWRGFSVELPEGEPKPEAKWALEAFLEHAFQNVCKGNQTHFKWLMGYFAHLIQRPWEKPLTALVFRGGKGTGKNILVDQVAALLRSHSLTTANRRYLSGNFNAHLENLLLFVLDEAFWSGDKQSEGVLKDLITGKQHVIEHKGQEPYTVDNCTRVVIIGNEEWVVPASQDERRFAVFSVGDGRKQDRAFFTRMQKGMEAGGLSLLLAHLMAAEVSDVNAAPQTDGLLDQKIESFGPLEGWLHAALLEGHFEGIFDSWPELVERETLKSSLMAHMRQRNIRSWVPDTRHIGRFLHSIFPAMGSTRPTKDGERRWCYVLPPLKVARELWEKRLGQKITWENADLTDDLKELI